MKNIKLSDVISSVESLGSYFITITSRDTNKIENDLKHYVFRKQFSNDDIVPSLDVCVRGLGVKFPQLVPVIIPKIINEKVKPLKIAIITHFNRAPDSYSPGKAVKNQIKLLMEYGHEVVFFVQEGSKLDVGCTMKPIMPKFKRIKNVVDNEAKEKIKNILKSELTDNFDIVITHDFFIDDCITYREAIKECGIDIKWLHWARSGIGRPIDFKMDNTRYVYMNYADVGVFAERINVNSDKVRVIFNEKDPALLFQWNPITKYIADKMKLYDKEIIQTYPICTTRMDSKGLNSVIKVFAELKKCGKKVALIICNSNGRRRLDEIKSKQDYAKSLGLTDKDIVFTSTLSNEEHIIHSEVPNKVVSELLQISNLFVFPTVAEVCSNVLLEASMTKNLLVLNEDLPLLFDFADENSVLKYPFTSSRNLHYSGRDDKPVNDLAKSIINQLDNNKNDLQFRRIWRVHNRHAIYQMLKNVLYE